MGKYATGDDPIDARGLRVAIVVARFNDHVTARLVAGAISELAEHGIDAPFAALAGQWLRAALGLDDTPAGQ